MNSYILVLNMGMKSVRSIVYSVDGQKVASSSLPLETCLDHEKVTQNPREWLEKIRAVVRQSVNDINPGEIGYMTVSASSSCLICADSDCNALGECIMVSDRRAESEAQYISSLTGSKTEPSLMLPKILWIKNHNPDIFRQAYKFLSPNDFLIARLTGRFVTDVFNAQKYSCTSEGYPEHLIRKLGIAPETLPDIMDIGTPIGTLTPEAAKELELPHSVKVMLTTYDAICSFFGSGVSQEGEASDVSGTVTAFRALTFRDDLKCSEKIFAMACKKYSLSIIGGSNNLGGGLIEWVKQCCYMNESYPYEVMEKDAYDAGTGAGGLIFLPYLLGERAPVWDNCARGVFFGLERSHTRKEMTRAVFDSTGFIDLDMINAVEETGLKVKTIRLSGGLSRINLISQIKADITGRDVMVMADFETTAGGAAVIALAGAGVYHDIREAVEAFSSVRMVIHPVRGIHEKYTELYRIYKEAYEDLRPLFITRAEITGRIYPKHEMRIANL